MKYNLFLLFLVCSIFTLGLVSALPIATNDSFTVYAPTFTLEEASMLANDDPLLATNYSDFNVTNISSPFRGNLTGMDGYLGLFNYTNNGSSGVDYFKYILTNGTNFSNEAYVIITTSDNTAPSFSSLTKIYTNSTFQTNASLEINSSNGLFSNMSNIEGDNLFIILTKDVSFGNLTLFSDGSFNYTANTNKTNGVDFFKYQVTDFDKTSSEVLVLIILGTNTAPVAVNDVYSLANVSNVSFDINVSANVLTNDSDVNNDVLFVYLNSSTQNGTLYLNLDGTFEYYPNVSFMGVDYFTYYLSDQDKNSSIVEVKIYVNTTIPSDNNNNNNNNGGSGGGSGGSSGGGSIGCTTKWVCSNWSSCDNGKQVRSCNRVLSDCYAGLKPLESQTCSFTSNGTNNSTNSSSNVTNKGTLDNLKAGFFRMTGAVTSGAKGAWSSLSTYPEIAYAVIAIIIASWLYVVFVRKFVFSKGKKDSKKNKK